MYLIFIIFASIGLIYAEKIEITFVITVMVTLVLLKEFVTVKSKSILPYGMLFLTLVIIIYNDLSFVEVVGRSKQFTLTIMMIICVTLLSTLINANGMLCLYRRFSVLFNRLNGNSIMMLSSALISPLLNMATPVIYGKVFKNGVGENVSSAANNVKRGMMLAMLVSPTFAPIALVIASHPGVSWISTVLYGLPLVFITAGYFAYTNKSRKNLSPEYYSSEESSGAEWIIVYLVLLTLFVTFTSLSIISSIILSALLTVALAVCRDSNSVSKLLLANVNRKTKETINKINTEALTFITSGILLISISAVVDSKTNMYLFIMNIENNLLIVLVLLFLPLLSLFKLHPIIGFTIIQPIVYVYGDLSEVQKYMIWICYWVVSLQISPVSVINLTTSSSFDIELQSITTLRDTLRVYLLSFVYSVMIILYGEI